jgi:hypothetical protein
MVVPPWLVYEWAATQYLADEFAAELADIEEDRAAFVEPQS